MAAVSLTEGIPLRLRNFFARYPPQIYSAKVAPRPAQDATSNITPAPTPYTPSKGPKSAADPNAFSPSKALLYTDPVHPNPFLPHKNPATGQWRGALVSLRRQNDLVKLAAQHGLEELLPPGPKSTEYRSTKLQEKGLRIKGTGIGQKVKGHKWERTMTARLEDRKKAMLDMPEMIRLWKQRGHGRGWKKYPK